jgi:hypothetical protein
MQPSCCSLCICGSREIQLGDAFLIIPSCSKVDATFASLKPYSQETSWLVPFFSRVPCLWRKGATTRDKVNAILLCRSLVESATSLVESATSLVESATQERCGLRWWPVEMVALEGVPSNFNMFIRIHDVFGIFKLLVLVQR